MKAVLRSFLLITLLCPVLVYGQDDSATKVTQINKVVIDPGHGGRHPGCVYRNFLEKDITLSVGLKLGDLIKKNFPKVQVIYTRTTDKYVDLDERGRIANQAEADLFISIHINSAEDTAAAGTSTWVMGLENSEQNLKVTMKENEAVIYEEDYSTKDEKYNPEDPSSFITFSLIQTGSYEQSMQFAEIIQKHFGRDLPMKDLGARQKRRGESSIRVLWNTSMPAVLTEIGFMSNAKDRAYITTSKGQNAAARSLFNAFSEYKSKTEGLASVIILKGHPESDTQPTVETAKPAVADTKPSQKVENPAPAKGGIKFYVQIVSLSKPKNMNSADFKSYRGKVVEMKVGGAYKYLVGGYTSFDEANRKLSEVKKVFKDAFVVAFDGSTPMKLDVARRRAK